MKNRPAILFRCDASPEVGLGHVVRCLALADELQKYGFEVGFAMREDPLGREIVRSRSYRVFEAPRYGFDYGEWLNDAMQQLRARVLVADVRDNLSQSTLASLASEGSFIVVIDDLSERRMAANVVFYPPVPQVSRADWARFGGQLFVGWEWVILRPQFAGAVQPTRKRGLSLLITMGGSDPTGLTLQAVRAADLLVRDFESVVILGVGFKHRAALKELLGETRRQFTIREDVSEMGAAMAQADVAVCTFGMTAYELAAMGIPAIHLCLSSDHAESASTFARAGMSWSLGISTEVTDAQLAGALDNLFLDVALREKMSVQARQHVDGKGANRVAEVLMSKVRNL